MRQLRGDVGLRAIEKRLLIDRAVGRSRATLSRYENGERPPLTAAQALDQAYDAHGWLEDAIARLWTRDWDPWTQNGFFPEGQHEHSWPAHWGGIIWMDLRPVPEHEGALHRMTLRWGAWRRDLRLELPAHGTVLATGKAPDHDGVSRDLILDAEPRVFALFGAGALQDDDRLVDIRRGWVRDEAPGPEDAHGPSDPLGDQQPR